MAVNSVGPLDIAVSGLKAQGRSMEVISSNVANSRTNNAGNGQPYRRLEAVLKSDSKPGEVGTVSLADVLPDKSDFYRILDPGSPNSDSQGYVSMPNVDLPIEMMNLQIASRAYQANAAVLKRYQQMVDTSLELLR
ncbi:MAG: flagellar basal body rod protein FlgC [Planctomycetes bacterium GWF2_50_10]|nr:MAG: flagellar basal body rod protein FlgC [Planctomycetes bacterium GWF2_50_10]